MAIALFKHSTIGKATQAQPYHAAARAAYAMRRSAANRVFSENMPLQWHAVQRFLKQHEDGLRKNGRVADTFVIAVPREFSMDEAEKVLRAYGRRIGKGKAPFLVAFHWEEQNPHAHFIFLDRDPETGKRVFGTSEKGSTELLKFEWAAEVNEHFEQLGLETRIEFGTRTEELQAAFNDNEVSEPSPTVAAEEPEVVSEEPPTLEELDNDLGRVDYEDELQEAKLAQVEQAELSPREAMAFAGQAVHELRRIRVLQQEREQIRAQYNGAYEAQQRASAAARQAAAEVAQLGLEATAARDTYITEHRGLFGKKGFQVSAFGYSYQSPARKAADAAELAYQQSQERTSRAAEQSLAETANLEIRSKDFASAKDKYEAIQGTDQELSDAELLYENTINSYAGNLTPAKAAVLVNEGELDNYTARIVLEELGYAEEAKSFDDGIER
jgi:hypothetical protein